MRHRFLAASLAVLLPGLAASAGTEIKQFTILDTLMPGFPGIQQWINSPPLTSKELRGRVVIVHFWTFD
jgi:hypothetical protein